MDPHSARVAPPSAQPQARLDVFRRARGHHGRPRAGMRPRQGDRRLVVDQRHGLCAGPPRRLRPLGSLGAAGMVVRKGPALFQAPGDLGARRRLLPRRVRPIDDAVLALPRSIGRCLVRGRRGRGLPDDRGLQRSAAGGLRCRAEHHAQWPALQRRRRVSQAGVAAAQSDGARGGARDPRPVGREQSCRRRVSERRRRSRPSARSARSCSAAA